MIDLYLFAFIGCGEHESCAFEDDETRGVMDLSDRMEDFSLDHKRK